MDFGGYPGCGCLRDAVAGGSDGGIGRLPRGREDGQLLLSALLSVATAARWGDLNVATSVRGAHWPFDAAAGSH